MDAANDYLEAVYRPTHNEELTRPARESGSAFVPLLDIPLHDILCELPTTSSQHAPARHCMQQWPGNWHAADYLARARISINRPC